MVAGGGEGRQGRGRVASWEGTAGQQGVEGRRQGGGHVGGVGVCSEVLQEFLGGGEPLAAVRVARYPVAYVGLLV